MSSKYIIAVNMEFVRSADKSFGDGVKIAAALGYKYIEPMVHTGWELLSEVNYFHSFSMEEDPLLMKEICDAEDIKVGSLSAHSPLMKPEAAIPRLTRAIILADTLGAKYVNTDEMIKPDWMTDEEAHQVMYYTLRKVEMVAKRHQVYVCIEPHGLYTKSSAGLLRIVNLVQSPWIKINWDTGNSYLAGVEDPYKGLEKVKDFVYHVHAKDISIAQSETERGKVTGTPVGCACGQGVVDWDKILDILDPLGREIILSVECGTIKQAEDSLKFLNNLITKRG
jgi:sugar phosphate isomerase/epimerase